MSFWNTVAKGANWLDETLGTNYAISRGVVKAAGAANTFYQKNIAGTFLEDVGSNLAKSVATQAVTGAIGGQQPGYDVPLPQARQISGRSGVNVGNFSAKQAQRMGFNNPRVQEAYRKAASSNIKEIAAAFNMVRPNIVQKGVTKRLSEAQIG